MSINIKKKALNVKNGDTYDNFDMFFLGDVGEAVDNWFEEHPDGAVPDGSLTEEKFSDELALKTVNGYVTPQMYGAKGDGVTDDTSAIQDAIDDNDTIFFPAGEYITTDTLQLHNNTTLFGVGRESKIINTINTGFNKTVVSTGDIEVGTNTGSFLNLPTTPCTIGSDRYSVELSDTSDFNVGDLIYVCKTGSYSGVKNPPYSWNAKITSITDDVSIKFDKYMNNDHLINEDCVIRNMSNIADVHSSSKITENICIHDLTIMQSVDEGSGMYVLAISTYKGDFYNLWLRGNTCIGSNYAVDCTFENISSEFDGGFCDIPELNQYIIIRNCSGKRYGSRQNISGFTFLMGNYCLIENNYFDFGNNGKIGFYNHINPIIRNNIFYNLNASPCIELSHFGNSQFIGNTISHKGTNLVVAFEGDNNIILNNIIDNPNRSRWTTGYPSNVNVTSNLVDGNLTTNYGKDDGLYLDFDIETRIANKRNIASSYYNTVTINAGSDKVLGNPLNGYPYRFFRLTLLVTTDSSFALEFIFSNDVVKTFSFTGVSKLELYLGKSNYINVVKNGDTVSRLTNNANDDTYKKITLKNTSESSIQLYTYVLEPIIG